MGLSCLSIWTNTPREIRLWSLAPLHHREYVNPSSIFLISVLIFNPIEILNGETEKEKKTLLVFIQITRSSESSGQESEVQNSSRTAEILKSRDQPGRLDLVFPQYSFHPLLIPVYMFTLKRTSECRSPLECRNFGGIIHNFTGISSF